MVPLIRLVLGGGKEEKKNAPTPIRTPDNSPGNGFVCHFLLAGNTVMDYLEVVYESLITPKKIRRRVQSDKALMTQGRSRY